MRFSRNYFLLAIFLFIIEVLIAVYVKDQFIRPYFGDFLVVILLYCFLKAFVKISVLKAALLVLLFSFFIEFLQLIDIVDKLELQDFKILKIVLGTSFEWLDMALYSAGIIFVVLAEHFRGRHLGNLSF